MTHLPTLGSTIAQMPTAQLAPILAQEARTFRIMSDASPDPEPFGEFPAEAIVPPRASQAAAPPEPLDETTIAASLVRMRVIGSHERPRLQPLDGGVSSDLWGIDVAGRPLCLKRVVRQLKVQQLRQGTT